MLRAKFSNVIFAVTAIVFSGAIVLSGCSRSPAGPDSENAQPTLLTRVPRAASGAQLSPVNLYTEKVVSSEDGGRLELLDVVLDIPPGAVPNDTLFSIFIPDDAVFFNEFGTNGLVFDNPVTVTMSYRDADLADVYEPSIRIAWLNESSGEWEAVECELDQDNKIVIAQLYHFSAYGLISDWHVGP